MAYMELSSSDSYRMLVNTFTGLKIGDQKRQEQLECMREPCQVLCQIRSVVELQCLCDESICEVSKQ